MPNYEKLLLEMIDPQSSVLLPLRVLHPTQSPVHLCERKASDVKSGLRTEGESFLFAHPIIASFLPLRKGIKPIILDGHHRASESFAQGIRLVPVQLFTLEQVARVTHQDERMLRWEQNFSAEQADEFFTMDHVTGGTKYWFPDLIRGIQTEKELLRWASLALLQIA